MSNPRLPQMLALLKRTEWDVEWHTNATLLNRRRAAQIVAANARHAIYLSLDGGTAAAFEANRGQGTWDRALGGAEALLTARGRRRGPFIGIYQLDLGVPAEQYDPRFVELTRRVDAHVVVPPVDEHGALHDPSTPQPLVPRGPCFWIGNAVAVDTQGNAWTCLLRSGTRLGSLVDESVDDILDRATGLRRLVDRSSRRVVPGCSTCRKREGDGVVEELEDGLVVESRRGAS